MAPDTDTSIVAPSVQAAQSGRLSWTNPSRITVTPVPPVTCQPTGEPMTGLKVHASMLTQLLDGRLPGRVSGFALWVVAAFVVLAGTFTSMIDVRPWVLTLQIIGQLAFFGAKVLHPKTIQPAIESSIPVRICNSRAPEEAGTLVGPQSETSPRTVKAIAHKAGVTTVQITSLRMLGAYGFLRALFEVFDRHRTVVDVVTTSEVSVSLSLDDASALPAIVEELERLGTVRVEKGRAIICVVGEGLRGTPGIAARVFKDIGDASINVDMIVQNISHGSSKPATDLSFTVDKPDLLKAQNVNQGLKQEIGFGEVIATDNIGKLSIVGVGMKSHTGVAGKLFETLAREGVNIDMISTSEIKVSVVIDLAKGQQALKAVHEAFLG